MIVIENNLSLISEIMTTVLSIRNLQFRSISRLGIALDLNFFSILDYLE